MHTPTSPPGVPSMAAGASGARPALVFRTALSGAAWIGWRGRRVRLDEDSWLALDGTEPCTVWNDRGGDARLLTVAIQAEEFRAARPAAAATGDSAAATESLRPVDGPVGRRLRAIAAARAGWRGADERIERIALAAEAIAEEQALRRLAEGLGCAKASTRDTLLRRLLVAADFIASHHDEPLSLDEMARAASLSRFHFARLFKQVHGMTPHAFLLRKRTAVARRHLAGGTACGDACARAGFGSRSALFRNLRKPLQPVGGLSPCFPSA